MNKNISKRVDEVISLTSLNQYKNVLISKLSKGYRQRTGIAQAILHKPKILILDEPTIGIDPVQVVETRKLIQNLGEDHTLILSSHILPEVTSICKRVLVIHEGKIVAENIIFKPEYIRIGYTLTLEGYEFNMYSIINLKERKNNLVSRSFTK